MKQNNAAYNSIYVEKNGTIYKKINCMKNIFTTILAFLWVTSSAQIIADPAVSQMSTIVPGGVPVMPTDLAMDFTVQLKVPVFNRNLVNNLPSGSCKIKIGLGSKMELSPGFNLSTINTSTYFNWTAVFTGGQVQITGDLVAPLPANFNDTAIFLVRGRILGNSTITTNFLITNHNTPVNLSDENPTNNNTFLAYTVVAAQTVPVTFTKVQASRESCNIRVNFDAENEINVDRFEIETSKDGINFQKVAQLAANAGIYYSYTIPISEDITAATVFVRIKSVDKDARFQYSETRQVSGTCGASGGPYQLFPNPANDQTNYLTVKKYAGLFKGKYKIALLDISGRVLSQKDITIMSTPQFNYEISGLPVGEYILNISEYGGKPVTIKWIKF